MINLLKNLNNDLLHRVKNLENELNSTKQKYENLMSNTFSCNKTLDKVPSAVELMAETVDLAPESTNCNPANLSEEETFSETTPPSAPKPRVLVYGDSTTRGFGPILQQLLPEYLVQCYTSPGAPFAFVVRDLANNVEHFTKKDIVFIMAGNNDVPFFTPKQLDQELEKLSCIGLKTNLIISSIPYKFHSPKFNVNIFASNQYLLGRSLVHNYYYFECNFFLSRDMYTEHGLHLNLRGKTCYNEMLHRALLSIKYRPTNSTFLLPNLVDENYILDPNDTNRFLSNVTCPNLQEVSMVAQTNPVLSDGTSITVPNSFFLS